MAEKEYIEREEALNAIKDEIENYQPNPDPYSITPHEFVRRGLNIAYSIIKNQPTAHVQEVRHGKWELIDECANEGVYCSNCHKKVYRAKYANQKVKSNYCPNCGAKMDRGEQNEEK